MQLFNRAQILTTPKTVNIVEEEYCNSTNVNIVAF